MKDLILLQPESIEGVPVEPNVKLGELHDDGSIVATDPRVTRGNLEARLRLGSVVAVNLVAQLQTPPDVVRAQDNARRTHVSESEGEPSTAQVPAEPVPAVDETPKPATKGKGKGK